MAKKKDQSFDLDFKKYSNKELVALQKELLAVKFQLLSQQAESSLHEFIKQAWPYMEGQTPFIDSWHIQAISEHLEACYYRQIKNLLINIPPRSSKTSLISVAFPAWVWLHNPEEKFMYASYANSLAVEHSLKCKRLIESEWYQERWGHIYQLSKDQKTKSFFDNNKTGYRNSTSVGASATGKGASILVCHPYNIMILSDKGFLQIGDIVNQKIDCRILSYNHLLEITEYKEIECYEKNDGRDILEIEFDDGTVLECTEDHPIFVLNRGYIAAKDVMDGDIVLSILSEGS